MKHFAGFFGVNVRDITNNPASRDYTDFQALRAVSAKAFQNTMAEIGPTQASHKGNELAFFIFDTPDEGSPKSLLAEVSYSPDTGDYRISVTNVGIQSAPGFSSKQCADATGIATELNSYRNCLFPRPGF